MGTAALFELTTSILRYQMLSVGATQLQDAHQGRSLRESSDHSRCSVMHPTLPSCTTCSCSSM